jgi:hypothetical protein
LPLSTVNHSSDNLLYPLAPSALSIIQATTHCISLPPQHCQPFERQPAVTPCYRSTVNHSSDDLL